MDFDFELEDILASIKEDKKKTQEPPAEAAPPVAAPREEQQEREVLAPPKPLAREQAAAPLPEQSPEPPVRQKREKSVKVKKEKPIKTKQEKPAKAKAAGNSHAPIRFSTAVPKPILLALVVLAAAAVVFGGIRLSQQMQLRSYERQYQMAFPKGIALELCQEYAEDRTFVGYLAVGDSEEQLAVYSASKSDAAKLQKGSDITVDQQFRSIAVPKDTLHLEELYKTPEAFTAASQSVTFRSLFDEQQYRVIAAYYTNTNPADDNGYAFPYSVYGTMTADSLAKYQDRIQTRRLYDTGYGLQPDSTVLTVSEPSDLMPHFRFVVVAVKVKYKVSPSDYAVANERVHYPQAYYDSTHTENIYFMANPWYPEIVTPDGAKQLTANDFEY